jgi:hypothetical protein
VGTAAVSLVFGGGGRRRSQGEILGGFMVVMEKALVLAAQMPVFSLRFQLHVSATDLLVAAMIVAMFLTDMVNQVVVVRRMDMSSASQGEKHLNSNNHHHRYHCHQASRSGISFIPKSG